MGEVQRLRHGLVVEAEVRHRGRSRKELRPVTGHLLLAMEPQLQDMGHPRQDMRHMADLKVGWCLRLGHHSFRRVELRLPDMVHRRLHIHLASMRFLHPGVSHLCLHIHNMEPPHLQTTHTQATVLIHQLGRHRLHQLGRHRLHQLRNSIKQLCWLRVSRWMRQLFWRNRYRWSDLSSPPEAPARPVCMGVPLALRRARFVKRTVLVTDLDECAIKAMPQFLALGDAFI